MTENRSTTLKADTPENPTTPAQNRMTTEQAAAYLGVCSKTLLAYVRTGRLPRMALSARRMLYRKADLDAFVDDQVEAMVRSIPIPGWVKSMTKEAQDRWLEAQRQDLREEFRAHAR